MRSVELYIQYRAESLAAAFTLALMRLLTLVNAAFMLRKPIALQNRQRLVVSAEVCIRYPGESLVAAFVLALVGLLTLVNAAYVSRERPAL